jgi:hypothetical protein
MPSDVTFTGKTTSPTELAKLTGLTVRTIQRLAKKGDIPGVVVAADGFHHQYKVIPKLHEWVVDRRQRPKGVRNWASLSERAKMEAELKVRHDAFYKRITEYRQDAVALAERFANFHDHLMARRDAGLPDPVPAGMKKEDWAEFCKNARRCRGLKAQGKLENAAQLGFLLGKKRPR